MAAKKKKKSEELLLLPPVKDSWRKNNGELSGKKFGNFGNYILLPNLDPVQNINTFYTVKKICKLVCEWYTTWRSWQKEVLLCSLSAKCSVSQLSSLSTILEPVFHRDFVSRLRGKYPMKDLKEKSSSKKKCEKSRKDRNKEHLEKKDIGVDAMPTEILIDCAEREDYKTGTSNEQVKSRNDLISKEGSDFIQEIDHAEPNGHNRFSLTDMVKQNLTESTYNEEIMAKQDLTSEYTNKQNLITECTHNVTTNRQCQSEQQRRPVDDRISNRLINTVPLENSDNIYQQNPRHMHTANVYKRTPDRQFFSASHLQTLSDMKANLPDGRRHQLERHPSDLDQKCYKHSRWWSDATQRKRLVSACGPKLWNHFTRQLREINERMDGWGDHERVNLLSEVIKSSDPEKINFFAQCLIQRLRDHTDVSILPDRTILKIFSKLDAKFLCRVSQVCRRWRCLGEDANLWRQKCLQLGSCKGIKNLIFLVEKSACGHHIDWKQAYQDFYKIFQNAEDAMEFEVTAESIESSEDRRTPKEDFGPHSPTTMTDIQPKPSIESLTRTPCQDPLQEATSLTDIQDVDELTGGNLLLLETSLLEIREGNAPQKKEEFALDIRPNKTQANNEMDNNDDKKHEYITVGVEDVKSVKRVRKLEGHLNAVFSVQFDSKRCLTGSADRVLRMWDVRSGRRIRKMLGHSGGIRCAQFDNDKIMSGSWDTTIMIWDTIKFTRLGILHGHTGCVSCLHFNMRHIVSGSHDMTIRVWDIKTWECLKVLEGHTGEITCLFLAGIFLITGSTDRTLKLWNIETGQCLKTLVGHKSAVLSVQASRALVISGSEEGKIMFWDVGNGECIAIVQGHNGPCNSLFLWKTHFLSGGGDNIVKQWDVSTLTCLRTLQGHRGPVQSVKMSSRRIVSSSEDGTVRIWDLEIPVQQIGRQYDEVENTLLPFDTLEHNNEDDIP